MNKKYHFETYTTPLAAFIKAKYPADADFDTKIITEDSGKKRILFIFESDTIDFVNIEQIYFKSFAQNYYNELQTLKNIIRTYIKDKDEN